MMEAQPEPIETGRFSQAFKTALSAWIIHMMAWLHIQDWEITLLSETPTSDDAAAEIRCIHGRRHADVMLCADFFEYKSENQQHYLIHELCHIVTDPVDKCVVRGNLSMVIGMSAWSVFDAQWVLAQENLTDHLACIVRDMMQDGEKYQKLWAAVMKAEK